MNNCTGSFPFVEHIKGPKRSSTATAPKSKTLKKAGTSSAKTTQAHTTESPLSDDGKTMYTCRSNTSSNAADEKQRTVLRKKAHQSTANPDDLRVPTNDNGGGPDQKGQPDRVLERQKSTDYPDLYYVLAIDSTHLLYDVRRKPKDSIPEEIYDKHKNELAIQRPTIHLRIISEFFPWTIDMKVDSRSTDGVRVRDIWKALYDNLQVPISDSEWAILGLQNLGNPDKRMSIQRAAQRRCGDIRKPCRIDWLGRRTKFCGMYRDNNAASRILHPSAIPCQETWVASFSNHI